MLTNRNLLIFDLIVLALYFNMTLSAKSVAMSPKQLEIIVVIRYEERDTLNCLEIVGKLSNLANDTYHKT
jgi:hypothetical protein